MNRAAATLPRDSHVPICGLPAFNARMTGFLFNVDPRFQSGNPEGSLLHKSKLDATT
jgi:hypothetical protein